MSEGPSPVSITTSISHVCVYRSGAVITRSGTVSGLSSGSECRIDGLPLSVADASVWVSASGGALVSGVRVTLALPPAGESTESDPESSIREAKEAVANIERSLRRLSAEQTRREKIPLALPQPIEDEPPRPAPAAAWTGLIDWLHEGAVKTAREKQRLSEELMAARDHAARLEQERNEARKLESARVDRVHKCVFFHLHGTSQDPVSITLEYRVSAACWVPTYVFRIFPGENTASIGLKALVAQSTGEAWERVRLSVSTAEPLQLNTIPELSSLRIGRRQQPPVVRGYRELPEGLENLFSTADGVLAQRPAPAAVPAVSAKGRMVAAVAEERPAPAFAAPSPARPVTVEAPHAFLPPPPIPPPAAAPQAKRESSRAMPMASGGGLMGALADGISAVRHKEKAPADDFASMTPGARVRSLEGASDDEFLEREEDAAPEEAAPVAGALRPREFDFAGLRLSGWNEKPGSRGRLQRLNLTDRIAALGLQGADSTTLASRLGQQASAVVRPSLPDGATPVRDSAGSFDYRYDSEALADIPCDGTLHTAPLFAQKAPVSFDVVCVPRERLEAYRTAHLMNPLAVPLLAGPADVYLGEEFLLRSPLKTVPAGGEIVLGLGVEEAVKISRNSFYNESAHGLLGGGLSLVHRVEIEVASRVNGSVRMDVRERVPVLAEKEEHIEVLAVEASPPWSPFDQAPSHLIKGGKRWTFDLAPGETKKLSYGYTVRIDSKNELAGGNRREA